MRGRLGRVRARRWYSASDRLRWPDLRLGHARGGGRSLGADGRVDGEPRQHPLGTARAVEMAL